ncbi:MAG: c-type cytochrome [Egibacteraceae bacterium]
MSPRACHPGLKWGGWLGVLGLLAAAAVALAPDASATQPTGDPDAGREVYAVTCAMCHGADASGMMGMHPALRDVVQRLTAEGVEVTIRNGRRTMPPMPAFGDQLADDEIGDVIAYLDKLPPGPRNFGPDMMDREGMMGDGGMMDRMMGRGWGWAWALVAVLLLLLVVAALVVVITQRGKLTGTGGDRGGDDDPRTILDRR